MLALEKIDGFQKNCKTYFFMFFFAKIIPHTLF